MTQINSVDLTERKPSSSKWSSNCSRMGLEVYSSVVVDSPVDPTIFEQSSNVGFLSNNAVLPGARNIPRDEPRINKKFLLLKKLPQPSYGTAALVED